MASVSDAQSVVYVLPDKMGGSTNIVANLLAYRHPDAFRYHVVLTDNHLHHDTRYGRPLAAVVRHDNFRGVQFHPERSASVGAQILRNFLTL